jgi:hypothetical protein
MPEPHLRAADTDRSAVAEALGEHMAAGRLTVAEFDERLSKAYEAKTFGELAELTTDLPSLTPAKPVVARQAHPRNACGQAWAGHPARRAHGDLADAWQAWFRTALIVITIWAATSLASWEFHYFWPVWVIGPWGAVLLAQTLTGGGRTHGRARSAGSRASG